MLKPGARVKALHSNVLKALHRQPTRQLSKRKDNTEAHPAVAPLRKHCRVPGGMLLKTKGNGSFGSLSKALNNTPNGYFSY